MTIAKRLAILIAIAVLSLVVVGVSGLRNMSTINDNLHYAHENSIPSIRVIGNIGNNFLNLRVQMLSLILAPEEQRPAVAQRVEAAKAKLLASQAEYDKLISDDKDRQYHDTSKALLRDYFAVLDPAISAIVAGDPARAKSGMGAAAEISKKLTENIEAHEKYNEQLAEQEVGKATAAFSAGSTITTSVIALAIVLTAILGFTTYRHVSGSLHEMMQLFARIESSLDFTVRMPASGSDEIAKVSGAFNRLLERLQGSFSNIARHAGSVHSAADRVAAAAQQMSQASVHQSEAASSMAATVEEMTVSINHVAERAHDANQLSVSSGEQAQRGETIIGETAQGINSIAETVRDAASQISQLEQQSERINNVVAVIKEVADQTNLLALNAAIEAARAGEQGRGFAVVADEVRKLAERTSQSTHEISTTITAMQSSAQSAVQGIQMVVERVSTGVTMAGEANLAIQEIGSGSRTTVAMVGDISDAIREQGVASTNIAQQVEKIAQISEENSAASQSTAGTAAELALLAKEMQAIISEYRV